MMKNNYEIKTWHYNTIIIILASMLFIPFLGGVHLFDWDEINFAESAREMIASGDYLTVQINFVPFWEKPPLFIWMQVLSMKAFGINEFAARFPNAICGIITLLVLFNTGRKVKDKRFGLLWVLLYGGSVLPFFYFKSGIIDPWFNLFIFLSLYQVYRYFEGTQILSAGLSAFFIGLAILTKGPAALLIFAITVGVYLLVKKFKVRLKLTHFIVFVAILVFTGGLWFILQILKGNLSIIADFITYQIRLFKTEDAGHGGFLLYHFVVLFFGVFPASVIALPAMFPSKFKTLHDNTFYVWMLILFWVVLILFTIVRTKIVHYSSLCYFPLTFLASWSIYHYKESISGTWKKILIATMLVLGITLAILVIGLTFIDHFKSFVISGGWIKDPFAVACLLADGGWKGYEWIAGIFPVAGLIVFGYLWTRNRLQHAVFAITAIIPVFMFLVMVLIVPRVESYSQGAAIEFFESVSQEDAYLETIGYKSYAQLYYGSIKNHSHSLARNKQWLLTGEIDKPAYFSLKITKKEKFISDYPAVEYLYEKNGFVFFKRENDKK